MVATETDRRRASLTTPCHPILTSHFNSQDKTTEASPVILFPSSQSSVVPTLNVSVCAGSLSLNPSCCSIPDRLLPTSLFC